MLEQVKNLVRKALELKKHKLPLIGFFLIISCLTISADLGCNRAVVSNATNRLCDGRIYKHATIFQAGLFHLPLKLKAICREDNDFVTNNDTTGSVEIVPAKVASVIKIIIDSIKIYDSPPGNEQILDCIYKVRMTPLISFYITKVNYEGNFPYYYIIGYDKGRDVATTDPPYIDGWFMENNEEGFGPSCRLLEPPLISFEDINDDGQKEIKTKERIHNGTMYNAEADTYYDIDDSMHLHEILSVESKSMDMINDSCIFYRTLKHSVLYDTMKCLYHKPISVGRVLLQINLHSRIISEKVDDSDYAYFLTTTDPDTIFDKYGHK